MDLFKKVDIALLTVIKEYLGDNYEENSRLANSIKFVIPPSQTDSDYSTNVAMVFAKVLRKNPNIIAQELALKIEELDFVHKVDVINGYINITFKDSIWEDFLADINIEKNNFGNGEKKGKVLLEFISANPTGPLHVGHCRGAILGLALSNLMTKAGYDVTKEYYINDYGIQINTLLKSIQFRYNQLCGKDVNKEVPEGCYPGDYLIDYAKEIFVEHGNKFVNASEKEFYDNFKKPAVNAMMKIITTGLKLLGLEYDSFVSESDIVSAGKIEKAIDCLKSKKFKVLNDDGQEEIVDIIYSGKLDAPIGGSANEEEQEESRFSDEKQTLFKSTLFGDDKDRVVLRSDGTPTYFASDIAYHKDKYDRGYNTMINLFGADHGGYVKRITSAVDAISDKQAKLEVELMQMVSLEKNGVPFKMSKRKGTFVLLTDVAQSIDVDELKLFMLSKSPDTQMTFDLVKVKEKSKDNLVYYIQYAYARTNSLLNNFKTKFGYDYQFDANDLNGFISKSPKLIKELTVFMAKYPSVIALSAEKRAPHMVIDYLKEFAAMFHSIWSANIKLVDTENQAYTKSVMAFTMCVQNIIENALNCMGIKPKKQLIKNA
ncbi:MAG: arginine--tRNA ligase [Clostridia bacterium]|nr:arginine--tRNA ligase [Clostridia bacterium]